MSQAQLRILSEAQVLARQSKRNYPGSCNGEEVGLNGGVVVSRTKVGKRGGWDWRVTKRLPQSHTKIWRLWGSAYCVDNCAMWG